VNMINYQELNETLSEYNLLSEKRNHTSQDKSRMAFLQTAIAAIKAGGSLQEIHLDHVNAEQRRLGLEVTPRGTLTQEQRAQVREFQSFAAGEKRDVEGNPIPRIGTYSGLGFFSPTSFFSQVFESMKAYDPIFSDDAFTQIRTNNGRVLTVPTLSDTENDAAVVGEAAARTNANISAPGQASLGVYSYASRKWPVSIEALQDLDASFTALELFKKFTTKALARGIGRDLLTGNGTNKTLGLIPSLEAAGATIVAAAGSSANDGGATTGTNSLGTQDFSNAYLALDDAYRADPSCRWILNSNTLGKLYGQLDKMGRPVVDFVNGAPTILGIKVQMSPSMANIGASNVPVLLGACSYWATRLVVSGVEDMGILMYKESAGLIENGLVEFQSFVRAGGALLWNDSGSPSPFVLIRNAS
jgi:HK97 family phage major capsid protein